MALAQTCEASETKIKEDIAQVDARLQQEDLQGIQRNLDEVKAKYAEFEARIKSGGLGGGGRGGAGPGGVTSDELKQVKQ